MLNQSQRKLLLDLTSLPTASGREQRVMAYIRKWVAKRSNLTITADKFGNLMLQRKGAKSDNPLIITAHMDHPAFVLKEVENDKSVIAEFRGWVYDPYFDGAKVLLFHQGRKPQQGKVKLLGDTDDEQDFGRKCRITFSQKVVAAPGDVLMWDTGDVGFVKKRDGEYLFSRGCDDMAGVAAALTALDILRRERKPRTDVRVLLTRAEEVGFVGALAACKSRLIPRKARLINVENSKSFAESPQGAGPIIRVGDRTSTFDPTLTYRISQIAQNLAAKDDSFKYQRRLMPGGTCEATAFCAFGYIATGVTIPLGNYHNMNETKKRIGPEYIRIDDYHNMVRLLVGVGRGVDDAQQGETLRQRLEGILKNRKFLLK